MTPETVPNDLDLEFALHLRDQPQLTDQERALCILITFAVTYDEALDAGVMDSFTQVIRKYSAA